MDTDVSRDTPSRLVLVVFGVAALLYLLQAFTPLRLTNDSLNYLGLADRAVKQGIHVFSGPQFAFPKGYSAFAFLLMKAGLFSSAVMVIANLLFFAIGLAFSFQTLIALGLRRSHALVACLLTLLSFAAVKHITQGMSDFLFFALAALACWLMTLPGRSKWLAILPCVGFAVEVRFIGLALLFPLVLTLWPWVRKSSWTIACTVVALVALIGMGAWAGRHYLSEQISSFRNYPLAPFLITDIRIHCWELGELICNAPLSKLPAWFQIPVTTAGGIALVLLLTGIVAVWKVSRWCSLYVLGYCCLILPWPYSDPRFWIPVMPFAFLTIYTGAMALLNKLPMRVGAARLATAYCFAFCALGFAALGYSTWLTFSGAQFPYRYGDGSLRQTYLTRCSAATEGAKQPALALLREYEWRCPDQQ